MENSRKLHTAAEALYGKSLTDLYLRMKRRSCERRLNNLSRAFQLIDESQSHFERSEVKRFIEVSPPRRRLKLLQSAKPRRMMQPLVAVCISPSLLINWIYLRPTRDRRRASVSSTESRLEKEKIIFIAPLINWCT